MSATRLLPVLTLTTLCIVAGCQSTPSVADATLITAPPGRAPLACAAGFAERADRLKLERTEAPAQISDSKGAPLRFANTISVNKSLTRAAALTNFDNGWSSLALRLKSEGAKSISVHLSDASLPRGTEVWLCSADSRYKEGPYRDAVGGDVWTPVVPGDEAWLEVLVPTARKKDFKATLAEVFGGFR
jgi:hypothetical protein